MKTDIGKYGKNVNGLTKDEVIELFNEEFEDTAAVAYFDFIQWSLRTSDNLNPFDDLDLARRDRVRDFIESRQAREAGCLQ